MNISRETSLKISLLTLVASVLIVCLHMPRTDVAGMSMFVELLLGGHVASVAVPFFFCVSGYLLGIHTADRGWYNTALRRRIATLLTPYLIWCVILGLAQNATSLLANVVHHQDLMRYINLNPLVMFGLDPCSNPPRPLWYMRALMLFIVLSPAAMCVIRRSKWVPYTLMLVLIVIGWFVEGFASATWSTLCSFTLAPTSTVPFLLGLSLSRYPVQMSRRVARCLLLMGVAVMMFNCVGNYGRWLQGWIYYVSRHCAIVLVLVGVWGVCPTVELPTLLKGQTFPIYLLHGLLLSGWLVVKTIAPAFALSLPGWFLGTGLMVVGSIVASALLRRLCPHVASVVFGGR